MYNKARTSVKNTGFYDKSWCSPGIDIESIFFFITNRWNYEKCTK